MTILIKLGGSLITDKRKARTFRRGVARDIARQLVQIRRARPCLPIILGHGSGSFGHFAARAQNIQQGFAGDDQLLGMARVGAVAAELNLLMLTELLDAGLPALRFPPSALLTTWDQRIHALSVDSLRLALAKGCLPLTHGDIALNRPAGSMILSTEAVFAALTEPLKATQILLLGEVDGVLDANDSVVPVIRPDSLPDLLPMLGASHGVDVTGGMLHKVKEMVALVARHPRLSITIANGRTDGILPDLLLHDQAHGTRILAERN